MKGFKITYKIGDETYLLYCLSEGVALDYIRRLRKIGMVKHISVENNNKTLIVRQGA